MVHQDYFLRFFSMNANKLIFILYAFQISQLKNVIPEGHPDVDDLFENPRDLPDWHPDLSVLVNQPFESSTPAKFRSGSSLPISVFSGHPDLTTDYDEGESVDDHPSVHFLFEEFLPPSHPDIDDLIHDGKKCNNFFL